MGLLDWLKRKKTTIREISPEELQLKEERRKLEQERANADLRIMLKERELAELELDADILSLEEELGLGEPEQDDFSRIISLFSQAKGVVTSNNTNQPNANDTTPFDFEKTWDNMDVTQKAMAKMSTDEQIKNYLKVKNPTITDEKIKEAIQYVRQN